jgi:hypothetical protein
MHISIILSSSQNSVMTPLMFTTEGKAKEEGEKGDGVKTYDQSQSHQQVYH